MKVTLFGKVVKWFLFHSFSLFAVEENYIKVLRVWGKGGGPAFINHFYCEPKPFSREGMEIYAHDQRSWRTLYSLRPNFETAFLGSVHGLTVIFLSVNPSFVRNIRHTFAEHQVKMLAEDYQIIPEVQIAFSLAHFVFGHRKTGIMHFTDRLINFMTNKVW